MARGRCGSSCRSSLQVPRDQWHTSPGLSRSAPEGKQRGSAGQGQPRERRPGKIGGSCRAYSCPSDRYYYQVGIGPRIGLFPPLAGALGLPRETPSRAGGAGDAGDLWTPPPERLNVAATGDIPLKLTFCHSSAPSAPNRPRHPPPSRSLLEPSRPDPQRAAKWPSRLRISPLRVVVAPSLRPPRLPSTFPATAPRGARLSPPHPLPPRAPPDPPGAAPTAPPPPAPPGSS